jgi:acyl carrier protein
MMSERKWNITNHNEEKMEIEKNIREFIANNLLFSDNGFGYPDDASFLEEGIVDSAGVMELVAFTEDNLGVQIEDHEITPDNFDSVSKLAAYVRRKTGVVA